MASSHTVTLSGKTSTLQTWFLPEIILDSEYDYSCALLDLIIKDCTNVKKIVDLNVIDIKCDIISESYINGQPSRTIHQFATNTSHVIGQLFVEIPKHLNYLPVKIKNLQYIQISIVDSSGSPIDISGGDIICRINIKRDSIKKNQLKHVDLSYTLQ